MTEDIERKLFGEDICFMFDKNDRKNRPVRGVHRNALTVWPLLPKILQNTFTEELGKKKLASRELRLTEMQWIDILLNVRDSLVVCPHCGDEAFVNRESASCLNPKCNVPIEVEAWLESDSHSIPLIKNNLLKVGTSGCIIGRTIEKPGTIHILLIQNLTVKTWKVITPSGKTVIILPKGYFPVKEGMKVEMTTNDTTIRFTINK